MKPLILSLLAVSSMLGANCVDRPCSAAMNYAWDATGYPDTRPNTWGTAAALNSPLPFKNVPEGYRVRVHRVYGDVVGWIRGAVLNSSHVGILWGLESTADSDKHLTPAQDACMIYVQGVIDGDKSTRIAFDTDVSVGGLLQSDNILKSTLATWLNDTGMPVHLEVTMTVVYQFEKEY